MQTRKGGDAPLQPLPGNVQERIWEYVRKQIKDREHATGEKIARFELHLNETGQIEIEVLSPDPNDPAEINDRSEDKVNRLKQREKLHDQTGTE